MKQTRPVIVGSKAAGLAMGLAALVWLLLATAPAPAWINSASQDLTPEIAEALGLDKDSGVVIASVEPGSPAEEAGLRRGDVVAEVNRMPVENTIEFMTAVNKADRDRPLLLYIRRGKATVYIPLK